MESPLTDATCPGDCTPPCETAKCGVGELDVPPLELLPASSAPPAPLPALPCPELLAEAVGVARSYHLAVKWAVSREAMWIAFAAAAPAAAAAFAQRAYHAALQKLVLPHLPADPRRDTVVIITDAESGTTSRLVIWRGELWHNAGSAC
jgi:hypothetical protein